MQRKPTFTEALIPIVTMLLLLGFGYGYLHLRAEPLLILAAIVAAITGRRTGLRWEDMLEGIVEKLAKAMPATLILISVGLLIGTWMYAGTIPMLIFYGVKLISPRFILLTAFITSALISAVTGSSWGSVGTIGVALIGISYGLGVSLPASAGTIVAGAYFGDKMSPLSDTTNLAPIAAGSQLYEHIRHMLYTTLPVFVLSLLIYIWIGYTSGNETINNPENVERLMVNLDLGFRWHVLLLLPLLIILYGSLTQKPTIPVMLISAIVAAVLGVIIQRFSIQNAFLSMVSGFSTQMLNLPDETLSAIPEDVGKLINRGGMQAMMKTVLVAFCAFSFAGILSKSGSLGVILARLLRSVHSVGGLIFSTVISCLTMAFVTGSSYLSILIPGELFSKTYKEFGLEAKNLSRTLEDSGTVVVPLVPWSMAGVYMAATLGVPVVEYAPWAFLCYLCFVVAIILGYTGFGITKIKEEKN